MPKLKCSCGKNVSYEPDEAGEKIRCPACKRSLVVPDDEEDDDIDDEEEDDSGERPAAKAGKKKQKAGPPSLMGTLLFSAPGGVMILVFFFIGIGLTLYGYYENKASGGASQEPTRITCEDLVKRGIPENANIQLSGFLHGSNYLYSMKVPKSEADKAGGGGGPPQVVAPWDSVFVPMAPPPPPPPVTVPPTPRKIIADNSGQLFTNEIRVMMMTRNTKNASELQKLLSGSSGASGVADPNRSVTGLVRSSAKLSSGEDAEIRKHYSGIDMDRLLILEEGRKPLSRGLIILLFIGGGFFLVGSVVLGALAFVVRPRGT